MDRIHPTPADIARLFQPLRLAGAWVTPDVWRAAGREGTLRGWALLAAPAIERDGLTQEFAEDLGQALHLVLDAARSRILHTEEYEDRPAMWDRLRREAGTVADKASIALSELVVLTEPLRLANPAGQVLAFRRAR